MNSNYGKAIKVIKDIKKKNGTRSLMSFYLMKSTKDDESDFSERDQFPIDSALSGLRGAEHQNKPSRALPIPRVFGLIETV